MIVIRHSDRSGLAINGSYEELHAIRVGILAVSSGESAVRTFSADASADPHPYQRSMSQLTVSRGPGPTRVAIDESEVRVDGDAECLRAFASYFNVPRDATPGWHTHHEHYRGNRWVAADSEPLVVGLRHTAP